MPGASSLREVSISQYNPLIFIKAWGWSPGLPGLVDLSLSAASTLGQGSPGEQPYSRAGGSA